MENGDILRKFAHISRGFSTDLILRKKKTMQLKRNLVLMKPHISSKTPEKLAENAVDGSNI